MTGSRGAIIASATARRRAHRAAADGLRLAGAALDLVPARWRFGHVGRLTRVLRLGASVPTIAGEQRPDGTTEGDLPAPATGASPTCALVVGSLDTGGVETVVEALARGLPAFGVRPVVVCTPGGVIAASLEKAGVDVVRYTDGELIDTLGDLRPDVIQVHRLDKNMLGTARRAGPPVVPVVHAIESYVDDETWQELRAVARRGTPVIAVSAMVRAFVRERVDVQDVRVVVNGARPAVLDASARAAARRLVGSAVGADLVEDILVVSLSRFSDQKNIPGLVDAFLAAAMVEPRLRLIVAGGTDNWVEFRRVDEIRRSHGRGGNVHLFGTSDAATLLSAADIFALNSFAEGGPMAALEAVASGLPLVVSEVGFTRELLEAPGVAGRLVERPTAALDARSLARIRRQRRQPTRDAFAAALLEVAARPAARSALPAEFAEPAMISGHAAIILDVDRAARS